MPVVMKGKCDSDAQEDLEVATDPGLRQLWCSGGDATSGPHSSSAMNDRYE